MNKINDLYICIKGNKFFYNKTGFLARIYLAKAPKPYRKILDTWFSIDIKKYWIIIYYILNQIKNNYF